MQSLDLRDGFDVADPPAWETVGPVDLTCLNAGVASAGADVADYRQVVSLNVDGVVFGLRHMERVMAPGSAIVVTASLAGLVRWPPDPVYALTKHAVVGFVRSVAPRLGGARHPRQPRLPRLHRRAASVAAAGGRPVAG